MLQLCKINFSWHGQSWNCNPKLIPHLCFFVLFFGGSFSWCIALLAKRKASSGANQCSSGCMQKEVFDWGHLTKAPKLPKQKKNTHTHKEKHKKGKGAPPHPKQATITEKEEGKVIKVKGDAGPNFIRPPTPEKTLLGVGGRIKQGGRINFLPRGASPLRWKCPLGQKWGRGGM